MSRYSRIIAEAVLDGSEVTMAETRKSALVEYDGREYDWLAKRA
ncbi:hypothetical protein [Rubritalea profundi]|nr:hypothetical protein [Rubritalea profundi]